MSGSRFGKRRGIFAGTVERLRSRKRRARQAARAMYEASGRGQASRGAASLPPVPPYMATLRAPDPPDPPPTDPAPPPHRWSEYDAEDIAALDGADEPADAAQLARAQFAGKLSGGDE
jgi:hypothetical protein